MPHPSELTLLNYIENKLSDRDRERIEHHLKFCSDWVSLLNIAQNPPSDEELKKIKVPEELIEKVKKKG